VIAAADALGADVDVHWFTDPLLTAEVVPPIAEALVDAVPALDPGAVRRAADTYVAELEELHREIESLLAEIPEEQRRLVATHDVFGPFAARYGLEVVGTVVAGDSTGHGASAGSLAELAAEIREAGVRAVFVEHGSDAGESEALAGEAGVDVVELFTESLGPEGSGGETYLAMMLANAEAIAGALTP
jgi:zinc/manganese transport system substrate-binding protein